MNYDLRSNQSQAESLLPAEIEQFLTFYDDIPVNTGAVTFVQAFEGSQGTYYDIVAFFHPSERAEIREYIEQHPNQGDLFIKSNLFSVDAIRERRAANNGGATTGGTREVQTIAGFGLDIDAGKSEKYPTQDEAREILSRLPIPYFQLVLSGNPDHGYHAWFRLDDIFANASNEEKRRVNVAARRLRLFAIREATEVVEARTGPLTDDERNDLIDRCFSIDRVLRPVGATRPANEGSRPDDCTVSIAEYTGQRFSLDELEEALDAAGIEVPQERDQFDGEYTGPPSPIREFCIREGISVGSLLVEDENPGYRPIGENSRGEMQYRRDGSTGTQRSCIEWADGCGMNMMSGGDNRFPCDAGEGGPDIGAGYSIETVFSVVRFGGDRNAADAWCHAQNQVPVEDEFEAFEAPPEPERRSVAWLAEREQRTPNALAERFVDRHGDCFRYVSQWESHIIWDGCRFQEDKSGKLVLRLTMLFGDELWRDHGDFCRSPVSNEDNRKASLRVAEKMNTQRGMNEVISLAGADPRILLVDHERLNAHPNLLNLPNGTYDFDRDEFREHRREDLLTMVANVRYDPVATCPRWEATLRMIFAGNEDVIPYVQRILGYAITGYSGEAMLPIAYGDGCNGKSTVWNTVMGLIGDYGLVANESLLLGRKDAHPTEIAQLYQKRLAAISEPVQHSHLKEARVKELTGDAYVTGRRMHEDFWSFKPTHTFWMSTNHLPRITGTDEGIWRRIKPVPFTVDLRSLEGFVAIADFHEVLIREEGPGILNWLIQGYRDYREHGFGEPQVVADAMQAYRAEQDTLGQFVLERCEVGEDHVAIAADLYDEYRMWGGKLGNVKFGKAMADRYTRDRPTSGKYRKTTIYRGLRINSDPVAEQEFEGF